MSAVQEEHWSSRRAFVLAAIGAAIGIGNVWRFPYICYQNGGGAFLIPYVIALATAGIPLLMLEFGLGYKAKAGAPLSFQILLGKKFEWIGWLAVLTGFAIVTYYCVIMAWAADYAFFSTGLAWGSDTEGFFFNSFLQVSDNVFSTGNINLLVLIGSVLCWIWIYFSVFRGVKSMEKMVYFTVILPWILILIFVVRGLTLPGAMNGIAYYLTPDFSVLLTPGVWLAAYGQIFFTLSLGWGVMVAYASLLPEKMDLVKNAVIIAVANCATSFLAGFAVFSTLGYLAYEAGVQVTDVVRGGIELAFITYPAAISLLPFAPEVFGVLFFFMLVTLGVGSAFASIEGAGVSICDFIRTPGHIVKIALCILGFAIGLLFMTQAGYYWLEIFDYYLSAFLLVIVGLLEAVAVGYFYGPAVMRRFLNNHSDVVVGRWWEICVRYIAPVFLVVVLLYSILERIVSPYGGYSVCANFVGWGLVILLPLSSVLIARALHKRA